MSKPTREQIREFWEWCGFRDVHYNSLGAIGQKWSGRYPKEEWRYLDIDLNNLFKYAVPIAHNKLGDEALYDLMIMWIRNVIFGKDPALALFWAIWEVIKNDKNISE